MTLRPCVRPVKKPKVVARDNFPCHYDALDSMTHRLANLGTHDQTQNRPVNFRFARILDISPESLKQMPIFVQIFLVMLILGSVVSCDQRNERTNVSDQKKYSAKDGEVTKEIEVPCIPPPDGVAGQCFLDLSEFGLQLNYPSDWVYWRDNSGQNPKSEIFIGLRPRGQLVANQFAIMVFKGKTIRDVEQTLGLYNGKKIQLEGKSVSTWNYYMLNPANPFEYYVKASGAFIHVLKFHVGAHYLEVARDAILKSIGSYSVNSENSGASK